MQRLKAIAELDGPIEQNLAVSAKRVSDRQIHFGILYHHAESSKLLVLHLAWHRRLVQDEADDWHVYIAPKLPPMRGAAIGAMCQNIWNLHGAGTIAYGFDGPNDCFDPATYEYLLTKEGQGLTCATFVLAILKLCGYEMVDVASWEARRDDEVWQGEIIDSLKGRASESHLRRLKNNIGAVRIRPTEVLAGAALFPPPVQFAPAATLGQTYENYIHETFGT